MNNVNEESSYATQLQNKSPEELVELFNKEVGVTHWVSARGRYLNALRIAFTELGIDYSAVKNESGGFNLSKGNAVVLEGMCLVIKPKR